MNEPDYKARCEFYQTELMAVLEKLVETQLRCIEAQQLAISRGFELMELRDGAAPRN